MNLSQIDNIVGRCHVAQSNLSVIRYFLTRVNRKMWWASPKTKRKIILREVIESHAENRKLFNFVMGGQKV
jgi:hypothetical protein